MRHALMVSTVLAATLGFAATAAADSHEKKEGAQSQGEQSKGGEVKVMGDPGQLEGAWRAERLLEADVYGPDGDEVGEVENIYIGPDGKIHRVLIETEEGFLGLGEQFLAVKWDDVSFSSQNNRVETSVDPDNLKKYSIIDDEPEAEGRTFRATELIGDYVRLSDAKYYGYVTDLVFSKDGKLEGLVTTADVAYGTVPRRVIPYAAGDMDDFDPGTDFYPAPYDAEGIAANPEYDDGLFD